MLSAFNIERLALALQNGKYSILNKRLIDAFTTDKFEIYFVFESLTLKITFFRGEAYFQFPETDKLQKKNRISIFPNLISQKVSEVIVHPFDRIFRLRFANQNELAFLLFGRFSQIVYYQGKQIAGKFPLKSKDFDFENIKINDAANVLAQTDTTINWHENLKFLTKEQQTFLSRLSGDKNSLEQKIIALNKLRQQALVDPLYLNNETDTYILANSKSEKNISTFEEIVQALDQFSRLYLAQQYFIATKTSHLLRLQKELDALKRRLASLEMSKKNIAKAGSYKEMADLLMANLYQIERGVTNVDLLKFDGFGSIKIKLKADLSPQANAERYYKKAKNEGKELDYLLKNITQVTQRIHCKEVELTDFEAEQDIKKIKRTSLQIENKIEIRLPYKQMEIDGFEVRVGKGAKDNDELLRAYSTKNDIWLHAKDVSGSHVIIRNLTKKQIPLTTIEKVAEIAAFYSKAKTNTLAAVIYTERKFVRKPKGANPGAVIVEKEKVILVQPKNFKLNE